MRRKVLTVAAGLIVMVLIVIGLPVQAKTTPFCLMEADVRTVYPSEQNWFPLFLRFNKDLSEPGTPEDYEVLFDKDGDFSTEDDQVLVVPEEVGPGGHRNNANEVTLDIVDFLPKEEGRFLVRVGEGVRAEDGSSIDPRYSAMTTRTVHVHRDDKLRLERVRYLGKSEAWPDCLELVADFNRPVWGTAWRITVTYDEDGNLATADDVKPVKIEATGDHYGPFQGHPMHSYLMLDVNGLKPGGRFKIQCSHDLIADDGDVIDPAHTSYVTDIISTWAEPKSNFQHRFSDIQDETLAAQTYALYLQGIISGVDERHFAPKESLTRAQFAAILARVLPFAGIEESVESSGSKSLFVDIPNGAWYREAVEKVVAAGLMRGTEQNRFAPNEKITREQLLATIGRLVTYDPASWQCIAEGQEEFLKWYREKYSD
ncbi:MAG TPA: S-layer homology domain-containing protein, partial [Firmicutes bacterium]|nr:S-layer homology domain-containing protein [Bacillota bacterium]